MNTDIRGSAKLMEENLGLRALEEEQLARMIKGVSIPGVNLVDYFPHGVPGIIDGVKGTLHVQPEALGSLAEQLWAIPGIQWKKLEVFPYGILAPDFLIVNFESVAGFN